MITSCPACCCDGYLIVFGERVMCKQCNGKGTLELPPGKTIYREVKYDKKRAARGMRIVHADSRYRDSNNDLGSVLLDLLHHAAREGLDLDKELEWAKKAFAEDTTTVQESK